MGVKKFKDHYSNNPNQGTAAPPKNQIMPADMNQIDNSNKTAQNFVSDNNMPEPSTFLFINEIRCYR